MTKEEAELLGYQIIKASFCEVGLIRGDRGVRTWWASDFDCRLPPLDNPVIMEAIDIDNAIMNRGAP